MTKRPPWRRAAVWGFLAGSLLFVAGLPLPNALVLGLAVIAVSLVLDAARLEQHDRPELPRHPRREGSRPELARLSRHAERRARGPNDEAVRRLRAVARRRLADISVEVEHPDHAARARALLGGAAFDTLFRAPQATRMSDRRFSRCIDAVESLADHRREHGTGPSTDAQGAP